MTTPTTTVTDQQLIDYFNHYKSYYAVAKETGLSPSTVKERLNRLGYHSAYNTLTGKKWVKLVKTQGPSRIISIPGAVIQSLGYKDTDPLWGTWTKDKNSNLLLKIGKEQQD